MYRASGDAPVAELPGWVSRPFLVLGDIHLSVAGLLLLAMGIVVVVVVARVAAGIAAVRLLARTSMDRGLQHAISRMLYYSLLAIGLMITLQTSGVQLGGLAVVAGALGVGIGFGLQNIVNNFVSGLILLVERPIQIGDWIDMAGTGGRVERIGARSTTMVTNDNVVVIVPNAELVTSRIINWSHRDPRVRIRIPVGVAYGSDLRRVREVLLEVANAHPAVLAEPPPSVLLSAFGESSLDLELAVWTAEAAQHQRRFRSDLNFAIEGAFREHGITVPFPQRDVHVKRAEAAAGGG